MDQIKKSLVPIFFIALIYSLEAVAFVLISKAIPVAVLFSLHGLKALFLSSLFFMVALYTLFTVATLPIYGVARSLGGEADLPKTRDALIWMGAAIIPLGLFCILLQITFVHPSIFAASGIKVIAYIGILATFFYALWGTASRIATVHKIHFLVALFSSLLGFFCTGLAIAFIFKLAKIYFS